jgi:hypothetical protein
MRRFLHLSQAVLSLGLVIGLAQVCGAYSLLTHEEVVDILWKDDIQPLLITRFPAATTEDLKKATPLPLAIGTFRRAISTILPEMTRVALLARKKELVAETPNFNARKFRYYLSRTNYQRHWQGLPASWIRHSSSRVLS